MFFAALLTAFSVGAFQNQVRHSSITGDVRMINHWHSMVLGNDRNLEIYLPPGYESSPKRHYPVLYMGDGQNIFDGMTSFIPNQEWRCDETAEALINAHAIPPLIIVGVDNAGAARGDEYLPTRAKVGQDGPTIGGKADLYSKMFLTELKPMIDKTFRTKPDRLNTAVGGSSLGGILSLYLGFRLNATIGKILAVSPSIWWDDRVTLKQIGSLPHKLPLKIWLDIGTSESEHAEQDARDAAKALTEKGWIPGKDLIFFVDKGASHNENAWAQRFPMMLMYLYRER